MVTISSGSICSDAFIILRSGLNNSMVTSHVNGVYATYPNYAAKDFPGLPILVINNNSSTVKPSMSGLRMNELTATITCYSNSVQTLNEAIDKAYRVIEGMCNVSGVKALNLNKVNYKISNTNSSFIGDKAYHQKDLVVNGWLM